MKAPVKSLLCATCVASAALTASGDARAQHYYAQLIATDYGYADNGAMIQLWTNELHSTCNILTRNRVSHELWYCVDNACANWVEVGFLDGLDQGGGCQSDVLYWANQRNGGGYHEHYPGNGWSWGTSNPLQVLSAGSCTWDVTFNWANVGTSTSNCPGNGRVLIAGIETTSQTTGTVKGWAGGWGAVNSQNYLVGWVGYGLCQTMTGYNGCNILDPYIKYYSYNGYVPVMTEEVLNESF